MLLKDLFNYADSVLTYTLLFGKSSFNTITLDFGIEGGVKKSGRGRMGGEGVGKKTKS